jgi:RNA polymerase sigma factor (sigma-70 family)
MSIDVNEFITSYSHIIDVIIRTYFKPKSYIDYDEMYSCGLIALWKAHQNYNIYKSSINTYIWIIIQREIIRYLKQKKRWYIGEICEDFAAKSHERLNDFLPNLSSRNKKIIGMRVDGYTLKEIAEEIGCSPQVVHYHLKKIINIIREVNDIT